MIWNRGTYIRQRIRRWQKQCDGEEDFRIANASSRTARAPDRPDAPSLLSCPDIVLKLNAKPTMRVEAGWFVTYLEGQRYVLGNTEAGIRPAVREAIQLCSEVRMCGGRLI